VACSVVGQEMPKAAMFNARIETADTSGAFKDTFKSTRCLFRPTAFTNGTSRRPMAAKIRGTSSCRSIRPSRSPACGPTKLDVVSCTIITGPAGEPMRQIQDHQPLILDPAAYDTWLDPATPAAEAKALLAQNLDGELQFNRVGRAVNNVKNPGGECIDPINPL
jgi:putative SOS response-associated peptidase YedK